MSASQRAPKHHLIASRARDGAADWFGRIARMLIIALTVVAGERIVHHAPGTVAEAAGRQPITTDACIVQPRRHRYLVALAQAPMGLARDLVSGEAVATSDLPGPGTPADAEVVASVNATARQLVACYNAGALPRLFALYSDDYLHRVWGGFAGPDATQDQIEAVIAFMSTPAPQPEPDRIALNAVQDVQQLPAGRVMAVLNFSAGSVLIVFTYTDGWYQVERAYPLP